MTGVPPNRLPALGRRDRRVGGATKSMSNVPITSPQSLRTVTWNWDAGLEVWDVGIEVRDSRIEEYSRDLSSPYGGVFEG